MATHGTLVAILLAVTGADTPEEPGRTTLSVPSIRYTVSEKPYAVLACGEVEAIVVDNRAVDDDVVRGHRGGYSGLTVLRHARRRENLFVPAYAGLNFEHIHDGTAQPRDILFEPRNAPMELRRINENAVELYQRPTPHWGLESCTRYEMLPDGAIEMTVECIPRRQQLQERVHRPVLGQLHPPARVGRHPLPGPSGAGRPAPRWIDSVSPAHGVRATHLAADDDRVFAA